MHIYILLRLTLSWGSRDRNKVSESGTYPAAPAARSASSSRLCPAGVCDFFVSCTGCILWLCLGFELETPVWQTAVSDTCRNYSNDASPQGFKVTFLKEKKTPQKNKRNFCLSYSNYCSHPTGV